MCSPRCHKCLGLVAAIILILLSAYLFVLTRNGWKNYNYIGKAPQFQSQIVIEGTGKITAKPDVALISIGVITDKSTVAVAQKENTDKMNAIIKSLKEKFKIAEEDLQTSQYSISPKYDWTNGRQRIIGYIVSQSISIKVRDFEKIGDVLAEAGGLGANSVSGPQFAIDDPEVYRAQAREKAIQQAKEKAESLAKQAGITLGPIVNFSENGNSPSADYAMSLGMGGSNEIMKVAPAIESGSQDISVVVTISYEIR